MASYPRYLIVTKCICDSSKNNISDYPELEAMLPGNYNYRICELTKLAADHFVCRFRVNIFTKDEALAWFVKFQLSTCTVFNKDRTFRENSTNIVYKVDMKCHHNTKPLKTVRHPDPRHTRCPSRLGITVRHVQLSRNYQSTDIHLTEFPTTIILHNRHNHAIDYGAEKHFLDRLKPPVFVPLMKQPEGPGMMQDLQIYVESYNAERQGRFCELIEHDKENFSVTLVSPIMKRILENVSETAEVLFADSTVKIEPYNCKLFLLLTDSSFGGLPVGCILTTSDREYVLNSALENYKSFLNSNCFNGQGESGPKVILTDHEGSGKKSFRKEFPNAFVSMSTYRVLQAAWGFTMDDNTGIPRERRLDFFCLLQQMVCCPSKQQLARLFDNIRTCPSITAYPKYVTFVHKMYESRQEWAECFKGKRKVVDQRTSKVCESAMRMVHENIAKWKKTTSVAELFHHIASDTESFFESHLLTLSNGRPVSYLKRNFKMDDFSSEKVGVSSFIVRSTRTNRLFFVESEIGICSCLNGKFGGMCKHQILVSIQHNGSGPRLPDTSPERRVQLLFIATGQSDAYSAPHSAVLSEEIQPQDIGEHFDNTELDPGTFSSISDSDMDEMSDFEDEEFVEDMMIEYTDEIHPTPNDGIRGDHLYLLVKEQNDSPEVAPSSPSGVQQDDEREPIVESRPNETSAESSTSSSFQSAASASNTESRRTEIMTELKEVFDDISLKMQTSGETFHAVEDFIKSYRKLNSESSLNAAFHGFGKFNVSS